MERSHAAASTSRQEKWTNSFSRPGFVALHEAEIELLQQVSLKGK